jgi:CRISPR-associated endonuclease Csn1
MIANGEESRFLCYHNDKRTFDDIMKVYNEYKGEDSKKRGNAFVQYTQETGDYVRKYAKNHKGCKIENLKYYDGKLGSCIDISHKYGYENGSRKVILESVNPYRMDVYYDNVKKKFYFVGLKLADFKFKNGLYTLDKAAYNRRLFDENLLKDDETISDLERKGIEFRLSFYRNEYIRYEKNGELFLERFLSSLEGVKNGIETKPIFAAEFPKRKKPTLGKTTYISKVRVDILGNQYECEREKFEMCIDNVI